VKSTEGKTRHTDWQIVDVFFCIAVLALDISELEAVQPAVQDVSAKWSVVYEKMNNLRTQASALRDVLATVCMCFCHFYLL